MSGLYVASNPTALGAQYSLTRNMSELSNVLTRLSTGLRINSGKDDPAGLIASELLKSDIIGTTKAITNTERANSMIATADSAMSQISNLLNDIKGLTVEAANTGAMSTEQIAANQLQVDASLESIDRIARSTTYAGRKLLDGSMDFRTNVCGGASGMISNLAITSANFGTADAINVDVQVQEAAKKGTLIYNGTGVDQKTTIDVTGSVGTKSFTFGAGTTNDAIAAAINAASDSTGVTAYVEGKAARGSVVLSSAGGNNDILITANEEGYANGNYTFRITEGLTNDVRIVSEPTGDTPGVVEISLVGSTETSYKDFAGLFNITIDAMYDGTGAAGDTSVNMTRGDSNKVQFFDTDSAANGVSKSSGAAISVLKDNLADANLRMSDFNGWTVKVNTAKTAESTSTVAKDKYFVDLDNKTIYLAEGADLSDAKGIAAAFSDALGASDAYLAEGDFTLTGLTGDFLKEGDSLTLGNGGTAGEVFIQYKAGATADDILKMLNNAPNVQASLKSGVAGSTVISNLPNGEMHQAKDSTAAVTNKYVSGATSQEVIDLINSKLGDKFTASALTGDGTGGRVSYMDAYADTGSVNLDNALRFTGMDNGPVIRMSVYNDDGSKAINQKLGVRILQPSEADIKNGITTPILEIQLATDASGNSITTAADIAKLFDTLTPAQTLGVSAEVLLPPGVDPNGGTWVTDNCNNTTYVPGCGTSYGNGIVDPTNYIGPCCDVVNNDVVLLGNNQTIVDDFAVARIHSDTTIDAATAAEAAGTGAVASIAFGETSALNGVKFAFTLDESKEGFDETSGTLTVFVNSSLRNLETDDITGGENVDNQAALVNSAIAANWEAIRAYTGSTLLAPGEAEKVDVDNSDDLVWSNILQDADKAGKEAYIPKATDTADVATGTLGVGANDPALTITAKDKGTKMADTKIYFVQDDEVDEWDGTSTTMKLSVEYNVLENGEKQLIIRGNMGTATSVDGVTLAASLNANDDFNKLFSATPTLNEIAADATTALTPDEAAGAVAFRALNTNNPNGVTEGGYRVDSSVTGKAGTGTSTGIGMTGQSDSNERLVLQATEAGSQNFVQVSVGEGSFNTVCPMGIEMCYLAGTDAVATINGNKATAQGNHISLNTADLAMSMDITDGTVGSQTFTIQGGGALFQLGPDVVSSQQMRIGIGSMMTTHLGGSSGKLFQLKTGGDADLITSDASRKLADRIVNEAISYVANTRGRLGAIQKSSLDPNIAVLQDSLVALTEAEASYSNADFAEESSNMTRLQLLVQSGMSTLAIANQFPQYAASLIR